MSGIKEITEVYEKLSLSDRIMFYLCISNDINVGDDNRQSFLIEHRHIDTECIYCGSSHIVKNGHRADGTQRFLCRDCHKSFIPSSNSVVSGTRKRIEIWARYISCMMDKKTLKETASECNISKNTAFTWRHKVLGALKDLSDRTFLTGIVEADETFFNVSYKGNHSKNKSFVMPRDAHKRGNDIHVNGLSSDKVCVPCAVNESGIAYGIPVKTGKISSHGVSKAFEKIISEKIILCTDNEKAYIDFSKKKNIHLIQMPTDCRMTKTDNGYYGIQRINAYHRKLKEFIKRFNGVSTKYLENYLIWNNIMNCSKKNRAEIIMQVIGHVLSCYKTILGRELPKRPSLPGVA